MRRALFVCFMCLAIAIVSFAATSETANESGGGAQVVTTAVPPTGTVLQTANDTTRVATTRSSKPAWDWLDDERLAVRFDPTSIHERAKVAAAFSKNSETTAAAPGRRVHAQSVDLTRNIIIGAHNPELLMPFELFSSLIEHGFVADSTERQQFRHSLSSLIASASLNPETFWASLDSAAEPYIANVRHERDLAGKLNTAKSDDERVPIRQQLNVVQQPQCSLRTAALDSAATRVGRTNLYRVLYEGIAPRLTVSSVDLDTPARFRYIAEGCR